ncbi:MAG: ribonuclease III [Lachnospiraceae bacterium]|nr:ribonuclease III [Lachnospiraceae bacterium]
MEKSVDIFGTIAEQLELDVKDANTYSPLVLAYIGDVVYELFVRTVVATKGNTQVNKMHQKSAALVKAETQAKIIRILIDELSEEEQAVYRRGRNAKSYTSAKHASISDYRTATGFEALLGYLYLNGETERLSQLVKRSLDIIEDEKS